MSDLPPRSSQHEPVLTVMVGLAVLAASTISSPLWAQDQDRPLTGKPFIDMDYGAFLGASIEVAPNNIAQKGIAIRLDDGPGGVTQGRAFAVFETDTLRFAGFWTGPGLIDWHGIALDGRHAIHPKRTGDLQWANPNAPGWADPVKPEWTDPRLKGVDNVRYGPLPRRWAHWKGLYRQGSRVILDYTVGKTRIREQPRLVEIDGQPVLERVMEIGASASPLIVQVAGARRGVVHIVPPRAVSDRATSSMAVLAAPDETGGNHMRLARDFSVSAWIRIRASTGTILSRAAVRGKWVPQGKTLFVRDGKLGFDIGWVGVVQGRQTVNDGHWHHVALTYKQETGQARLFVDGRPDGARPLKSPGDKNHIVRLGYTATNFMAPFRGAMDEVQVFHRTLTQGEIGRLARDDDVSRGRIAHWTFDQPKTKPGQVPAEVRNTAGNGYRGANSGGRLVPGHKGLALSFSGKDQVRIGPSQPQRAVKSSDWTTGEVVATTVGGSASTRWLKEGQALRLEIAPAPTTRLISVFCWKTPGKTARRIAQKLAARPDPLRWPDLATGGDPQWKKTVVTQVSKAPGKSPLVVDEVTLPTNNPWRSWMRLGGFDFFRDTSRAAICTWQGDVWIVEGLGSAIDKGPGAGQLTWKRIAAGLFQPLGLKILDDRVYVLGRDQITRLVDLNGDGETDYYENFNNDAQVTEHFHEFAMDLQADAKGNFYYMKGARHALPALVPQHGSVIRVSADGSSSQVLANGFRAPNGLALNDDGSFLSTDQEGHWTPMNRINWIRPGGFYGNMMSYVPDRKDTSYDPPLCWIHKQTDRSPSAPVWVTSDKWALPRGSLLSLSYGTGRIWRVLHEQVGDVHQGGITRLPIPELATGIHRGRFHPDDGQLYVCGLFGWSSNKTRPGGLFRIRATGQPLELPESLSAVPEGLVLRFVRPLDRKTATEAGRYNIQRWNYRRAASYGSRDYRVSDGTPGRDRVEITGVQLSRDSKAVLLRFEDMKPCMQMRVDFNVATDKGSPLVGQVEHTINVVRPPGQLASLGFDPAGAPVPRVRLGPPRKDLAAGLVLSVAAGSHRDTRVSRLAALAVEPGDAVSSSIPPGAFSASLEGLLDVELTDSYIFTAESTGSVEVRINDEVAWTQQAGQRGRSVAVPVPAGLNRLSIRFASPASGSSRLRVFWQSSRFVREVIPSRVLWHTRGQKTLAVSDSVRRGRRLFQAHRCSSCHAAGKMEARPSISLALATARFNSNWMSHWIANPSAMRNHTRMPKMFGSSPQEVQAMQDVLAFLIQLEVEPAVPAAGEATRGQKTFEQLGCVSCHTFNPASKPDEWNRTSLHLAGTKYFPGALSRFLKKPHEFHPGSRMPDFRLSDTETQDLVALIQSRSTGRLKQRALPLGNPGRGKRLFVSRGCASCHASDLDDAERIQPLPLVPLQWGTQQVSGCLADAPKQPRDGRRIPQFAFSRQQQDDIRAYLARPAAPDHDQSPLEWAQTAVQELRCAACHDRDTSISPRREILAEESERGLLPSVLPNLTWAGEKLQADWTTRLLTGRLKHPSRPWLKARMPSFGTWGEKLARGLAAEHGVPVKLTGSPSPDRALADIGKRLTIKQGGFNCVQCHGIGQKPAQAPFDNRGVNFSRVKDRLRYGFYLDWMFDPLRLDPHSKMPRFSPDRKTTAVRSVLDGDARRQFDALWHYLQGLPK